MAMKFNNLVIPKLYTLLAGELEKREPFLTLRTLSEGDRQRQGLALTNARFFITILANHIFDRTGSVVFSIEIAEDCYKLRFYWPLGIKEYNRLAASGYAPILRSKIYLTVGVGKGETVDYAYSEVRMSQYASVIDMFDALVTLGKELEKFILAG